MTEERQLALDAELVPLRVAAQVAYFHITDALRQIDSNELLEQIVPLVAIALSTVAPIHRVDGEGGSRELGAKDLREHLYRDRREPQPSLEALAIRRGDLRKAMATLKEARVAFGKPQ